MTTDRTTAPVRPAHAERPAAQGPGSAASGFAGLLGGAHAASARPAARAASEPRDAATKPREERVPDAPAVADASPLPGFVLTVATPPPAAPATVPVTLAPEAPAVPLVPARAPVPAAPPPTGAIAASARISVPAAPVAPALPQVAAAERTAPALPG